MLGGYTLSKLINVGSSRDFSQIYPTATPMKFQLHIHCVEYLHKQVVSIISLNLSLLYQSKHATMAKLFCIEIMLATTIPIVEQSLLKHLPKF